MHQNEVVKNDYISLIQEIQNELLFGKCGLNKYVSKLQEIACTPAPEGDVEKSAFFLLTKALKDIKKIETIKKNNNDQYLFLINTMLSLNHFDTISALSTSESQKQDVILKQYDEKIEKLCNFLGHESFVEFAFRRALLVLRTEEIIVSEENRVNSPDEIIKALHFFENSEWKNNFNYKLMKSYHLTSPTSKIQVNDSYLKNIEQLDSLLKLRYNESLPRLCYVKYREMHYYHKNHNFEEAIRVFKTLPPDFYEDDQGVREINPLICVDILNLASQVYWENGKKDLAKVYQEISYSICSSKINNDKGFAKKRTLIVAEKLRNYYLKDKNFNLIRGLEARAEKYGMTPLPKQEGEN